MKKKFYFPDGFIYVLACLFLIILGLIAFCFFIHCLIVFLKTLNQLSKEDIFMSIHDLLIIFIAFTALFYKFSQYVCYTIILDEEKIYIHEDTNPKKKKIQYYCFVNYNEIKGIDIIWSNRRSNGEKSSEYSITAGSVKVPYLRIEKINGEKEFFMIMYMSKRTLKRLIVDLKQRLIECENDTKIGKVDSIIKTIK